MEKQHYADIKRQLEARKARIPATDVQKIANIDAVLADLEARHLQSTQHLGADTETIQDAEILKPLADQVIESAQRDSSLDPFVMIIAARTPQYIEPLEQQLIHAQPTNPQRQDNLSEMISQLRLTHYPLQQQNAVELSSYYSSEDRSVTYSRVAQNPAYAALKDQSDRLYLEMEDAKNR